MRIVVLGGAGAMAQVIIRDLLESPEVESIAVAGDKYVFVSRAISAPGMFQQRLEVWALGLVARPDHLAI